MDKKKKFKIAYETRKLELELFWKRYSVFWTVTAAVFVAYGFSKNSNSDYSFIIACFGIVTSYAWFLINRGNKYWQETWEKRVHENEPYEMFNKWESIQKKGFWSAARYSVSKIAIMISYYVFFFWLLIAIKDLISLSNLFYRNNKNEFIFYSVIILLMFIGIIILEISGRTTIKVEEYFDDKLITIRKKGKVFISEIKRLDNKLSDEELKNKFTILSEIDMKIVRKLYKRLPNDEKLK